MVQVEGTTYRIVRIRRGSYDVVRILDDVRVGKFSTGSSVTTTAELIDNSLMREIARVAIQGARTSWVGRLALA